MAYSQAKNKQQQESDKRNCVQVKFKFTKSTDADILEWLSALDNKQGYIKRLIRRDLEQKWPSGKRALIQIEGREEE